MLELNSLLEIFLYITLFLLIATTGLFVARIVKGPTIWDKLLMVSLINANVVLIVVIFGLLMESIIVMDIAIAYGVVGFLIVVLLAKFVLTGGREK